MYANVFLTNHKGNTTLYSSIFNKDFGIQYSRLEPQDVLITVAKTALSVSLEKDVAITKLVPSINFAFIVFGVFMSFGFKVNAV
jgi:hypothetical protein